MVKSNTKVIQSHKSWSFRGDGIQWNVLEQTAAERCEGFPTRLSARAHFIVQRSLGLLVICLLLMSKSWIFRQILVKKKALNTTCQRNFFSNRTDLFHVYAQTDIKNLILTIRVLFPKAPKIYCSFPEIQRVLLISHLKTPDGKD